MPDGPGGDAWRASQRKTQQMMLYLSFLVTVLTVACLGAAVRHEFLFDGLATEVGALRGESRELGARLEQMRLQMQLQTLALQRVQLTLYRRREQEEAQGAAPLGGAAGAAAGAAGRQGAAATAAEAEPGDAPGAGGEQDAAARSGGEAAARDGTDHSDEA
eukprot:TRINITY_DN50324_c0_g1_i1.p2 TRINITY_DN50324_c0_g1~~TRINITY_DN50324_c0_g1_i1.p2  ORF type:complete len:161 (+),score=61.34 TRINITY_DN50324_c0_g1_i1:80-562(+)